MSSPKKIRELETYSDWQKILPTELSAAIAKRLDSMIDYVSFRGVCNSWRSAATFDNFDRSVTRVPWLMYVSEKRGEKIILGDDVAEKREENPIFGDDVAHDDDDFWEKIVLGDDVAEKEGEKLVSGDDFAGKEEEKSILGDDVAGKGEEKSMLGDDVAEKAEEKSVLGDDVAEKREEDPIFGDDIAHDDDDFWEKIILGDDVAEKEGEKLVSGDDFTGKEEEKSIPGDDVAGKGEEKSMLGEDVAEKAEEKSVLGDDVAGKGEGKSMLGDDVAEKGEEKSILGDDVTEKIEENAILGDNVAEKGEENTILGDDDDAEKREVLGHNVGRVNNFFDLERKTSKITNFPPAVGLPYLSSGGWILNILNDSVDVRLTHPVWRVKIELPGLDTLPAYEHNDRTLHLFIRKMVLSASPTIKADLVVMVIWGDYGQLGFSRPGDDSWTVMAQWDGSFCDIVYHNGMLYAVDYFLKVVECDVHGNNPTQIRQVFMVPEFDLEFLGVEINYLVESSGKFLIVSRLFEHYRTVGFRIFELDLMDGSRKQIHHLGSKALFLGFNSSICLELSASSRVKPNRIYFTDHFGRCKGSDTGVYKLSNKRVKGFSGGFPSVVYPQPTWVMPSF